MRPDSNLHERAVIANVLDAFVQSTRPTYIIVLVPDCSRNGLRLRSSSHPWDEGEGGNCIGLRGFIVHGGAGTKC